MAHGSTKVPGLRWTLQADAEACAANMVNRYEIPLCDDIRPDARRGSGGRTHAHHATGPRHDGHAPQHEHTLSAGIRQDAPGYARALRQHRYERDAAQSGRTDPSGSAHAPASAAAGPQSAAAASVSLSESITSRQTRLIDQPT